MTHLLRFGRVRFKTAERAVTAFFAFANRRVNWQRGHRLFRRYAISNGERAKYRIIICRSLRQTKSTSYVMQAAACPRAWQCWMKAFPGANVCKSSLFQAIDCNDVQDDGESPIAAERVLHAKSALGMSVAFDACEPTLCSFQGGAIIMLRCNKGLQCLIATVR